MRFTKNVDVDLDLSVEEIARAVGRQGSDTQAIFFNAFNVAIREYCGSQYHAEFQLAYVQKELSESATELFQMLLPTEDE